MPTIGRYEIEREIGRGAMGVVYLANDPRLRRQVALKTCLLPDGISEELAKEFHARFVREAQAAASLSHPGIVTVYDAGEDAARNIPYIAMEFVQGQSLKQRLEKGGCLDPAWVVAFGAVLAEALHVAHRAGIVHRDIKPANILIREGDGAVKIADFGVARLKSSDLTQSGASLGSPGYMSPEQVRGGALDGRSDLFSLAVVLYEALCGKRPFHGDDLVSLAYSIAHDTQVPLSRQLQSCPAGLDRFFDHALSKDPEKRFADGAAFRQAFLEAAAPRPADTVDQTVVDAVTLVPPPSASRTLRTGPAGTGAGPAPRRAGRGRRLALALGGMALLAVGLAAAAYLRPGRTSLARVAQTPPPVSHPDAEGAGGNAPPREPTARQDQAIGPVRGARERQAGVETGEPVAGPPRIPRMSRVTVPAGTELHLILETPVGSASSQPGDTITARVADPVLAGDRVALPAGCTVHGRVRDAIPARKGLKDKAGSLSLSFDSVVTSEGLREPMSGSMTAVAHGSGKRTAGIIGGGAAGGALLGRILGGRTKSAAVGSIVGGAIGAGIAAGTRGEDVELAAQAPLTITLDQPLTISISP